MAVHEATSDAAYEPTLRDPSSLWPWFRGFIVFYLFLTIAVNVLNTAFLLLSGGSPDYVPEDPASLAITFGYLGVSLATVATFIVCAVLTARLTYRMMRNLHQMNSPHVTIGPRWAVGWYFIPFANLVMPVKAVSETWRGTFAAIGEEGKAPGGVIGLWWTFWLIGNICDGVAERMIGGGWFQEPVAPSPDALTAALVLWSIGGVVAILACLFMLRVFGQLARGQSQMVRTSAFQ